MIVAYTWITRKHDNRGRESIRRYWKGYFLLGILPLYICNLETKYFIN